MKNFGGKSKKKSRSKKVENRKSYEKSYEKLENKINQKFEYIWLTLDPTMIYIWYAHPKQTPDPRSRSMA